MLKSILIYSNLNKTFFRCEVSTEAPDFNTLSEVVQVKTNIFFIFYNSLHISLHIASHITLQITLNITLHITLNITLHISLHFTLHFTLHITFIIWILLCIFHFASVFTSWLSMETLFAFTIHN